MTPPKDTQARLIDHVAAELARLGHRVDRFETHISSVLVAGGFAYKFKKAVRFDFLDFSTLEARRFYCNEELRLNRRLAPRLYLDVVRIAGDPRHPHIDGNDGNRGTAGALEYAVRMRAFEQDALWSRRLSDNRVTGAEADELAEKLARFHLDQPSAPLSRPWGAPQTIAAQADDTFNALFALVDEGGRQQVAALRASSDSLQHRLADAFRNRKASGMVRECHGDLHCGNVLSTAHGVEIFDCIEFNAALRWIDVMNDLAFICMDLECRGRRALAARLLNHYLEITGDYAGVTMLPYYRMQRALVRARVTLLRARQPDTGEAEKTQCLRLAQDYLALAAAGAGPSRPAIMIAHGFSGSGKTHFCRLAAEILGAIQVRSDVERKRIHGLAATDRPGSLLYDSGATGRTYDRLLAVARGIAAAGVPVIVDAAFLQSAHRIRFAHLADELGLPFFIFDVRATPETMRERIAARMERGRDASDAGIEVLRRQLAQAEPLSDDEELRTIPVDTESGVDHLSIRALCARVSAMAAKTC